MENLSIKKEEVIRIFSHELKNPINAIRGSAFLVKSDPSDKKSIEELAEIIINCSNEVINTLNNFIAINEFNEYEYKLKLRRISINEIVNEIISENSPYIESKSQEIILEIPDEKEIFAVADKELIAALIQNILSNASKHSPDGSFIQVILTLNDDKFRMEVRDQGKGFDKEQLKSAFVKDNKFSNSKSNGETSHGLGLSIAKKIVDLHEGYIWIRNQNKGSSIFFELPIQRK